ncbi:MAG: ATP phosphoribosyltransferase regulatory subunit [Alphaproteobacteria bacterium]|nr:ATP phosphoribosyltransferase regulatory subunit [Alphaproteobacteria bacterium]
MTGQQAGARALERIAEAGSVWIDPPTLGPARPILELSGEALRARLCTFTDSLGEEICLRPDMTTPIATMAAGGVIAMQRYHYAGTVYRLPPPGSSEPIEFGQIGFEWFGGGGPDEDADALAVALGAARAGGVEAANLRFGDVALFRAVVDALDFPASWSQRLKLAFARRRGATELLREGPDRGPASALSAGLAMLSADEAGRAVEEILAIAGVQPVGGRSAAEIAERLRDAAGYRAPPAGPAASLIEYLEIEGPAGDCLARLGAFAQKAGLDLSPAMEAFRIRLKRIEALDPPFWNTAVFSAEAGRRFEYYDGFVFDLCRAASPDRPVVAGGRYDGLTARMSGGKRSANATGAMLRVDRLVDGGGG